LQAPLDLKAFQQASHSILGSDSHAFGSLDTVSWMLIGIGMSSILVLKLFNCFGSRFLFLDQLIGLLLCIASQFLI
jgi:hypothetical protein